MKLERDLKARVLEMLRPLHGVAINATTGQDEGTPDVNCTAGWIELKFLKEFPKQDSSLVIPNHFKPEQRNWLRKRCQMGGRAWLLLVVNETWCLVWGTVAADAVGVFWKSWEYQGPGNPYPHAGRRALMPYAMRDTIRWDGEPDPGDLRYALTVTRWPLS